MLNRWIQNILVACIMASSMTALLSPITFFDVKIEVSYIPIIFTIMFCITILIAEDVRNSFKKVFKFEQRKEKRPIWQVGVGMLFYFAQIGIVEVFFRSFMGYELGGMPLYLVIAFLNAFLATVIYEEVAFPYLKHEKKSSPRLK